MERLTKKSALGASGIEVPPVIFGTSALGNLYQALSEDMKLDIMRECFEHVAPPVVLDTAGKYGAGLALEVIGKGLKRLGVAPEDALISNKLGWAQAPLLTPEPTFEQGVWIDLEHDAEQRISYEGILTCWEQGCELLGDGYRPQIVSVHDPDEYLAAAESEKDKEKRFGDIIEAYRALTELKDKGEAKAVGVGAKDWRVIKDIAEAVDLDWVMLACSLTIMKHPPELLEFINWLNDRGIGIINSAVFNAGFLTGGEYFDYRKPDPNDEDDRALFTWRDRFFALCDKHGVSSAEACVQFGMSPPGVVTIALNTSKPNRVAQNVAIVQAQVPGAFWADMKQACLISKDYPYVG